MFAACGTGEFHALDLGEYGRVVQTDVTGGAVPVFAGAGGSLPSPTPRHLAELAGIIDAGLALAGESAVR